MKVKIIAESDSQDDGFTGKTTMEREDVEDLQDMLWLFSEFFQASGFTYVKAVAVEKDDGTLVWSDF
jgi:hypothetical protein